MRLKSKRLQNKALLLVGFAGGFRRSELVSIEYEDLDFVKEGVKILIPVLSKAHEDPRLNKTLKKCFVSSILDKDDFALLNRNDPIKKGGGKKKGKKKKK